jgi:hypothetical protein
MYYDRLYLEEALAYLAVVGLVRAVHAEHVLLQVWQLGKCFVAQLTHMGFLACKTKYKIQIYLSSISLVSNQVWHFWSHTKEYRQF